MHEQSTLLSEAAVLNPQLVSLPRIQLLQALQVYGADGIEFRELQAHMRMTDGKLLSNLYALRGLGMIRLDRVRVETKNLTIYHLTPLGIEEWARTKHWLRKWLGSP